MTLAGNHRLPGIRLGFYHRHLWEWTTMAENRWTHDGRKLTGGSSDMTKWEYCVLLWMAAEVPEGINVPSDFEFAVTEEDGCLRVHGGYLRFFRSPEEAQLITERGSTIAQLGLDGWELVSHTVRSDPIHQDVYYFKRLLA